MEEIKNKELAKELLNIKSGETIYLNLNSDICNRIELINFQVLSYNNLFMSYINNTCEESNQINLESFLNKYTDLYVKQDDIKKKTLLNLLGTDIYNLIIKNNIICNFNTAIKKIELRKMMVRKNVRA